MRSEPAYRSARGHACAARSRRLTVLVAAGASACASAGPPPPPRTTAATPAGVDPRISLRAGIRDAGEAARGMELVSHRERPPAFVNAADPGDIMFANSDMAFQGSNLF